MFFHKLPYHRIYIYIYIYTASKLSIIRYSALLFGYNYAQLSAMIVGYIWLYYLAQEGLLLKLV